MKTKTKTKAKTKAKTPGIKIKAYGIEWGPDVTSLPSSKTLTLKLDADAPDADVGEAICDALEKAHPGYRVLAVCWDRSDRGGLR